MQSLLVLAVQVGCVAADGRSEAGRAEGIQLGIARERQLAPSASRAEAAAAWQAEPSPGRGALLARAYYPELAARPIDSAPAGDEPLMLRVTPPSRSDEPFELRTRGMVFKVARLDSQGLPVHRTDDALHQGDRRLWAPAGATRRAGASLLTTRFEEYEVVEGGGVHRARYRIDLPRSVDTLREAGEYLELRQGVSGAPVLRLHHAQVRDAAGVVRTGRARLFGAEPREAKDLYAISGVLEVELEVELGGLSGPLVVDPGFSSTGAMATSRLNHTLTLLTDGRVLVAGGTGTDNTTYYDSAELYDPQTASWTATGPLPGLRAYHTATLLSSGQVLVAGGRSAMGTNLVAAAAIYNPESGTWTAAGDLGTPRTFHTATMLRSGKVLIVGGRNLAGATTKSVELFTPGPNTFIPVAPTLNSRSSHTATLLPSGAVMLVGGVATNAELYDEAANSWTDGARTVIIREEHATVPLHSGKLLVVGGNQGGGPTRSAEIYDPATNTFVSAADAPAASTRSAHLLPSGKVLLRTTVAAYLYDPATNTWTATAPPPSDQWGTPGVVLPSGKVLIAGNVATPALYDPGEGTSVAGGRLPYGRSGTLTLLGSGKVLIAGGQYFGSSYTSAAMSYDPATSSWTNLAPMSTARRGATATLLRSGKVLVAGGDNAGAHLSAAELFDPVTGTWSSTSPMPAPRFDHSAIVLADGRVLVAGGFANSAYVAAATLYDPGSGTWSFAGTVGTPRASCNLTRLPDGKVLMTGGFQSGVFLDAAEYFDPASNGWFPVTSMNQTHYLHTATLLPNGKVLVVGGNTGGAANAEVFTPDDAGTWTPTGATVTARRGHAATLLPSGEVLVTGGVNPSNYSQSTTEVYDLGTNGWTASVNLTQQRANHLSVPLPGGEVFLAAAPSDPTTELINKSGAPAAVRPVLTGPSMLAPGTTATLRGANLRGVSTASTGATNDAAANVPVVVLQSAMTGALTRLKVTSFSDTAIDVVVPASLVPERYIAWVTVAGVHGGRMVRISAANTAPVATSPAVSVTEDTPKPLTLPATDGEDDPLAFTVLSTPVHGTLSGAPPHLTYTPNGDYSGSDSFLFKASDGTADSALGSVSLSVSPVNDPPTLDAPAELTVNEDCALQTVPLTGIGPGGGGDEVGQSVTVTASSSTPALIPDPAVTGAGSSRWLTFTPAANATGTSQITVTARDDGAGLDTTTRVFTVTVSAVNDAPTLDALADLTVAEDAATQTVPLAGVGPGGGADESGQVVTVTATSSNPLLVPHPQVTGTGPSRSLAFTPALNATGSATITVTATDDGGTANGGVAVFSRTFQITLTPVNDAPTLDAIADGTTGEDTPLTVPLGGVAPGGGADEAAQVLAFTATSDNTAVVPNPSVTGAGASRALLLTPASNATGSATITVTVKDDAGVLNGGVDTIVRTFTVTVTAVNDAPVFDPIANGDLLEDASAQVVTVTGLSPGGAADEAGQSVTLTATSSDPSIVPDGTVSGTGSSRNVHFTPAPDAHGSVTITVTATDDGGTTNGGIATLTRTFVLNVASVNDAPTLAAIADQSVAEDAAAIQITLSGIGAGGGALEASQAVSLSASVSDPSLVAQVSVSGIGASRTLSFTPAANASGSAVITVTALDDGGTANGGVAQRSRTFTVTITPVNDPPSLSQTAPVTMREDVPGPITLTGIGPGGGDDEATQTTVVTVTSSAPALLPNPTVTGTGATRTLQLTPSKDATGTLTLTVTVQDTGGAANGGQDTSTGTISVTLAPVNDQPTFDPVPDQAVPRNSGAHTVQLTGVAPGGGADEELQAVTLTATSSNPSVISDVTVTGDGSVRQLRFATVPGARGPATLTLVATDSGGTGEGALDTLTRTLTVTVTDTNAAPSAASQELSVGEGALPITLEGEDPDGTPLTFTVVALPQHGTLTGDAPALVYTPDPGFSGDDAFTFRVSDGELDSEPATVTLHVTAKLRSYYGWGCAAGGADGSLAALALLALALRRRRPPPRRALWPSLLVAQLGLAAVADAEAPATHAQAPAPAAASAKEERRLKLAFLGFTAGEGVTADSAASVAGYLQSELIALGAYDVIGAAEIRTLVGMERQKQLLGCSEESESCAAEIAGALDSDRAVTGDVSRVGQEVVLNISLIDLKSSKALSRVGRRMSANRSESALLDAGRPALIELLSSDPALAGRKLNVPSRFGGLLVGVRGEADVAGRSVAPAVMAELSGRRFGGALVVLVGPTPGFRTEGRYYPLELGPVRPYLAAGATVFVPAVAVRGAAGASLRLQQLQLFGDVAYERFVNPAPGFNANAVLASLGVGWQF